MGQNCNRTTFAIVHLNLPPQMCDRKIHGSLEAEGKLKIIFFDCMLKQFMKSCVA
jgi:hypothetical protein